jgi:hypothetical protein
VVVVVDGPLELVVVPPPAVVVVVLVDGAVVDVVVARVVVVGRAVEVVGRAVVAGVRGAVAVERVRGRARVVVEEAPAKRPRGRRVVDGATCSAGARAWTLPSTRSGAVRRPRRLPPPAPRSTATARVAHRRSALNRSPSPPCTPLLR